MAQIEVRCDGCNKLLGKYIGNGTVICPRCGGKTEFDTKLNKKIFKPKNSHPILKNRATSSGVTFR